MNALVDLFPGFEKSTFDTLAGPLFVRAGGCGPALLLLHGFPQTGEMWHRLAPALAQSYRVVIPDLPGYGRSAAPPPREDHWPYSKRAMADAMKSLMDGLGHEKFRIAAHDRGARVAYRLALDHPASVVQFAALDIVPTLSMWDGIDRATALQVYHWTFLAQPHPFPERMIGNDPQAFLDWTLASWTASKDLSAFDPRALAHYRASFSKAQQILAACEDYRAGASTDVDHDLADLNEGRTIACPVLAVWADNGIPSRGSSPLDAWRRFAGQLQGVAIPGGHFLCEESPAEVLKELERFFGCPERGAVNAQA